MKLLLAEDEKALSEAVVDILTYHKYIIDAVYNGEDAYDYAMYGDYDGIILDIMMPKKDGLQVLTELRENGYKKPVMLLTAKSQIEDRIKGMDTGADDYLTKPFDMGELLARIRAMLRRGAEFHSNQLHYGDLTLDIDNGTIFCAGKSVEKAWSYNADTDINSVWLYISYLRKRLASLDSKVEIISRRSFGYKLEQTS